MAGGYIFEPVLLSTRIEAKVAFISIGPPPGTRTTPGNGPLPTAGIVS